MSWRRFLLCCPKCRGYYYVKVIEPYDFEICPFGCGFRGKYQDFVEYEVIPDRT